MYMKIWRFIFLTNPSACSGIFLEILFYPTLLLFSDFPEYMTIPNKYWECQFPGECVIGMHLQALHNSRVHDLSEVLHVCICRHAYNHHYIHIQYRLYMYIYTVDLFMNAYNSVRVRIQRIAGAVYKFPIVLNIKPSYISLFAFTAIHDVCVECVGGWGMFACSCCTY